MDRSPSGPHPTRERIAAWRAFLDAHRVVTDALAAELIACHDLPLEQYDVLVQLSEAEGSRLRMHELARRMVFSRSGLSRLIDRMQQADLVVRERCDDDRRGFFVVMTSHGLDRLRESAQTHLAGVAERVTDHLDDDEIAVLHRIMARVRDASSVAPRPPVQT